jgi:hypothetical protein
MTETCTARGVLEFLRDHQRADGKIEHELTQSAALLDWSQYPYGYYHADTTALYRFLLGGGCMRATQAIDFVNSAWTSLDKAYRYCESVLDDDGLMSNVKGGAAAVETGALSGRVAKDVYLAGAWLAALEGFANLAVMAGHSDQAERARAQLEKGRASLNAWLRQHDGFFPFGRLTDGSTYDALSGLAGDRCSTRRSRPRESRGRRRRLTGRS